MERETKNESVWYGDHVVALGKAVYPATRERERGRERERERERGGREREREIEREREKNRGITPTEGPHMKIC